MVRERFGSARSRIVIDCRIALISRGVLASWVGTTCCELATTVQRAMRHREDRSNDRAPGAKAWNSASGTAGGWRWPGRIGACVLALGIGSSVALGSGLRFESERIEFRVAPEQRKVAAQFAFTNESDTAVRIEAVHTDCACLRAEAPEGEIPPGGQGAVSAEFEVGSLRGVVEKHLWVMVREGKRVRRVLLDAVLVVPELVVENSPKQANVSILPVHPSLKPFTIGICSLRRKLSNPLIRAFWELARDREPAAALATSLRGSDVGSAA